MLSGSSLYIVIGSALGLLLVAIGVLLGRRGRHRNQAFIEGKTQEEDREAILTMLKQLGNWTTEYSGNVNQFQREIRSLSRSVENDNNELSEAEIKKLLGQIMSSNDQLQERLDAAEQQLEQQTKQIENYLSEARTDSLTGLYNRRAFDKKLEDLFDRYRGGGSSFVLVLIDIDHFKQINDTFGHQAGDLVLQRMAQQLNMSLSEAHMVARFGGEEFTVLIDGPLRIAAEKLNDVRKQIAATEFEFNKTTQQVTISVGLSEPREDLVTASILRRADEALYAAKHIGRNRTYYHDGKAPTLVGAPDLAR